MIQYHLPTKHKQPDGPLDEAAIRALGDPGKRIVGLSTVERTERRWKATYIKLFDISPNEAGNIPSCCKSAFILRILETKLNRFPKGLTKIYLIYMAVHRQ